MPSAYTRPDRHALYWYSFDVTDLVTAGEPVQLALRHQYETDTSGGYNRETRVNHHGATVDKRPTLLVTYTIAGDIDGDGSVNVFDILCIAEAWNTVRGDANFNPACDLDGDGFVNVFDIFVVAENWNRS